MARPGIGSGGLRRPQDNPQDSVWSRDLEKVQFPDYDSDQVRAWEIEGRVLCLRCGQVLSKGGNLAKHQQTFRCRWTHHNASTNRTIQKLRDAGYRSYPPKMTWLESDYGILIPSTDYMVQGGNITRDSRHWRHWVPGWVHVIEGNAGVRHPLEALEDAKGSELVHELYKLCAESAEAQRALMALVQLHPELFTIWSKGPGQNLKVRQAVRDERPVNIDPKLRAKVHLVRRMISDLVLNGGFRCP